MKNFYFSPLRTVIRKLKSIDADPVKIRYGFAFGVFMSTTPLIGFKWAVALPIVWLAGWNKVSCLIGILQVNYVTGPLFYALAYFVGRSVCGFDDSVVLPETMNFGAVKDLIFGNADVFLALLTGGLILSIPMTIGAYYLARSVFPAHLKTTLS